jgi:rRNA maturation RNase YbeY
LTILASTTHSTDSGADAIISIYCDHESASLDVQVASELVGRTLQRYLVDGQAFESISVVLSNRTEIRALNRRFLGHDYPTDVLSFLLTDDNPHEGEVYVDLDMASERCEEFGSSFELEAYRYIIHGVLHLLGMDDSTPEKKEQMHFAENEILKTLSK